MIVSPKIVYYSRTRQTQRFIEKLQEAFDVELSIHRINTGEEICEDPYILITPTYRFGNIPEQVEEFLENETNANNIIAVISNGNKNWGTENFANSGRRISEWMNVPWLHKFEMRGNTSDVEIVKEEIIKAIKEQEMNHE